MIEHDGFGNRPGKVVYLKPQASRRVALRRRTERAADATSVIGRGLGSVFRMALHAGWQVIRVAICALLVLLEPFVRMVLVSLAFLAFVLTLIVGFWMGDPRFPKWGMLAFSVGAVMLYWLFLGLMSMFMELPRDVDRPY